LAKLLKNQFFLAYLALYIVLLALMHTIEGFGLALPLFVLLFMGAGLSALAWWTTRGITAPDFIVKRSPQESILLLGYLLVVVGYLTWGVNVIEAAFEADPARSLAILVAKLVFFVLFPLLLFRSVWRYSLRDFFRPSADRRGSVRVIVWMSLFLIIFQLVVGQGLTEIRAAEFTRWQLALGILLAYAWLVIEVGLVEEFFFRGLIQSRLSALLRSEVAGVVLMAALFGLAHAPGIYFRSEVTMEAVGSSPSLLMAVGYSIVVVSITGFFLGVIWVRTKSLYVLALIHAAGDLVPNAAQILRTWYAG
jgi:membrane protease YdiL (CAAX protease family)